MTALSSAIAAMDKVTPGEWATWKTSRDGCEYLSIGPESMTPGTHDAIVCDVTSLLTANDTDVANAKVIRASKLALTWIKEALPWLEIRADEIRYELDIQETLMGPKLSDGCIATMKNDLAALDALIARAKPEEVGR